MRGISVRLGGEEHSGWPPPGAAPPPPTPIHEAVLNVRIEETDHAYLLICHSRNTADAWDSWHASVGDAQEQARAVLGIEPGDWQDV